ncbi:MAG: YgfZ/GcvT domain-containing protein [Gammaproteobacteria bacterium]
MTDWPQFLAARGARMAGELALSFGETPADYDTLLADAVLCDLGDLGVLSLSGPDSAKFLQGQSTADFSKLTPGGMLRGACCNLQGRVFTSFVAFATDAGVLLVMNRALVAPSLQTLAKYAVFSKTRLADASDNYRILGLAGDHAAAILATLGLRIPDQGSALAADGTLALHCGDTRFLLAVPTAQAQTRWLELEGHARPAGLPLWHLLDIRAGLTDVRPETGDQFLPQMLNYHHSGAVSFTKGCYTGQEVVARTQYRGKLKRHLHRLSIATAQPPAPGTEVTLAEAANPVGTLVLAAPAGTDRCEALVVLRDEARDARVLAFGGDLIAVEFLPLPYPTAAE